MNIQIMGLAGTNGAGKDSVAHMLVERHNYYFASATDMLAEELKLRGLPTDRVHKSQLSAEWRRQFGMAAIVERVYEYYKEHEGEYGGLIVGSLRHPAEADYIHEIGGTMLWVDAEPRIRFERVAVNAHVRGRHLEDNKTFEEFMADEEREMQPTGDEATLHGAAVKQRADIIIENNGNDLQAFMTATEKQLGLA